MDDNTTPSTNHRRVARFDRWAGTYDRSLMQRLYFIPVQMRMLDFLGHADLEIVPHCVVDVGCGTGRLLQSFAERWPEAQLIGVDPAEGMIVEARQRSPGARFECAPAEALPLADGTVDLVLSSLSLHHWADQQQGLCEVARVLRPGGYLCLADQTTIVAKLLGQRISSLDHLRDLFTRAGLTLQQHLRLHTRFAIITLSQKQASPGAAVGSLVTWSLCCWT